jgi:hypothetical protein
MYNQAQYMSALDKANATRLRRSELKKNFRAGEITIKDMLAEETIATMWILDLLMVQRRWGRARAARLLNGLLIPQSKQVGTLTERQRNALIAVLNGMKEKS